MALDITEPKMFQLPTFKLKGKHQQMLENFSF